MSSLAWILLGGLLMSAIALVGSVTVILRPSTLERLLLPLVSLAAGTLLGGAFFHMIPAGTSGMMPVTAAGWVLAGFVVFLALEQFLHWRHSHVGPVTTDPPVTRLILIGDGLHNFIGGLGVASAFLLDPRIGLTAWLAAAAHEVPQELGDFGVLVHAGWSRRRTLFWNFLSGLTFLAGALVAYLVSFQFNVAALVLFGAGNFIYIGATDLIPEIKAHDSLPRAVLHFGCFVAGLLMMAVLAVALPHGT
jgi:zinc and cadmium transporter